MSVTENSPSKTKIVLLHSLHVNRANSGIISTSKKTPKNYKTSKFVDC